MFDKTLFDRNAFDRSVSSGGIDLTMLGSGQVVFQLTIQIPIGSNMDGNGSLTSNIQMQQHLIEAFTGVGDLNNLTMILKRATEATLSSQGALESNIVMRTPISAALSGTGGITISSQMLMYQFMQGTLSGSGAIIPGLVVNTELIGLLQGSGQMSSQISLQLPLIILHQGEGVFALRRIGGLNENAIELIGINFLPGETITIDTDLLQVLFGSIEDVSSITSNSIFFELNPGENEITIDADTNNIMDVTAIWQNRWL